MIQMEPEDVERIRETSPQDERSGGTTPVRTRCQRFIQSEEELRPTESLVPGSARRGEGGMAQTASLRFCRGLARRPRVQFHTAAAIEPVPKLLIASAWVS